jgi:hypothetical protein
VLYSNGCGLVGSVGVGSLRTRRRVDVLVLLSNRGWSRLRVGDHDLWSTQDNRSTVSSDIPGTLRGALSLHPGDDALLHKHVLLRSWGKQPLSLLLHQMRLKLLLLLMPMLHLLLFDPDGVHSRAECRLCRSLMDDIVGRRAWLEKRLLLGPSDAGV